MDIVKETSYIASARRTIAIEKKAIERLDTCLDENFTKACQLMIQCQGRVIVVGLGKSGHVGRKIAATLASTGTPSFFVHAGEASHGDVGMITGDDAIIVISHSGKTEEILRLLPLFRRVGAPVVSITGNRDSVLAKEADLHLYTGVNQEACPLDLAPTSSTTVTLVIGDALAIALLEARGFTREDFAFSHPAGSLGTRLLLKVDDIMHEKERLPVVPPDTLLSYTLLEMSSKGLGMTAICDAAGRMMGIFTDGDLRRAIDKNVDPRKTLIEEIMTKNFVAIPKGMLAAEALNIMQKKNINGLFCVDDKGCPVGAFNMLDLVKAGIL